MTTFSPFPQSSKHLILFDSSCPLCWNAIRKVKDWDKKHLFLYEPLSSDMARGVIEEHKELHNVDSLMLIENFRKGEKQRIWLRGRAVLRIFWLLGGFKKCIGWMAFLPFGVDGIYRLIARHRHRL
ncbi:MAG TPA: DUF393 domain-containing protein [Rhabdochlamydiaceae bacterium]|jgi:predicted DCC family thiol-disulfide oxidoreductase YuxK